MKTLIAILLIFTMSAQTAPTTAHTILTKIYEDDQIELLTSFAGSVKKTKLHAYDFKIPLQLAEEIPTRTVYGKFTDAGMELTNALSGQTRILYQFKSDDNSVWWMLSADEIGKIPSSTEKYALVFCDNGTTEKYIHCDCSLDMDCECYLYDDIFITIFEI